MKSQFVQTLINGKRARQFALAALLCQASIAEAGVIVTPATNANGISADHSSASKQTAFTPIGDIIISEQDKQDFAFTDRYWRTMILTAPAGWEFNTETGKAITSVPSDFRVVALKMTAHTITIRFCVKTTEQLDVLTISGIEVKAQSGIVQPGSAYVYRSANNPGTAMVSNITPTRNLNGSGGTNFASLSVKPGKVEKLVFSQKPYATEEGSMLEGQTELMTVDQFGNFSTEGLADVVNVRLKLSDRLSVMEGQTVMNIGTAGGNGRVSFAGLKITQTGMKKMIASAPSLSFAVTGDFLVYEKGVSAPASGIDPELMCVK